MRWCVALVSLSACSRIFGLAPPQSRGIDAQYFDAPADAPFACPADGSPPQFSPLLHQVFLQTCYEYSIAWQAGFAVATCTFPSPPYSGPSEGPIDGSMTPAMATNASGGNYLYSPYVTPEGDKIYSHDYVGSTQLFYSYLPAGLATWTVGKMQTVPVNVGFSLFGAPTQGPQRHMMATDQSNQQVHELVELTPDTWTDAATPYTYAELGAVFPEYPSLTPDGLRIVVDDGGANAILYGYRAAIDQRFPKLTKLSTLAGYWPILSPDCGRLYMNGLSTEFYLQQQ